jgi:hypothetical protein
MGLDGHQAPPIPGRPIVRKPRPSPRRGFPIGCEAGTVLPGKWSVQEGVEPQWSGDTLPLSQSASSAEPREGAGKLYRALTLGGAASYG